MTEQQFDALAKLIRLRASASAKAAKLYFVQGLRVTDAAKKAGCSPQAAQNSISSCRKACELVRLVQFGTVQLESNVERCRRAQDLGLRVQYFGIDIGNWALDGDPNGYRIHPSDFMLFIMQEKGQK